MLQAITKKSNIFKKIQSEDEITAMVFGPMEFFPSSLAGFFWHFILQNLNAPNLPKTMPIGAIIHFWPKEGIEPDITVDLEYENSRKIFLLIEVKWDSALSGKDQLHKQWKKFVQQRDKKDHAYHLFLAKQTSEGRQALELESSANKKTVSKGNIWQGRLLFLTWHRFLALIKESKKEIKFIKTQNQKIATTWSNYVKRLMHLLNIRKFGGFRHINSGHQAHQTAPLFWHGWRGFQSINETLNIPENSKPIFFGEKE